MEKKSAAAATSAVSQASDSAHSATVPALAQSSSGAAQATASAAPHSAKPASRPRYCVERDSGSDSIRSSSLSLISRSVLEATCAAIRNTALARSSAAAMLATLHVAVFRGVADPWARALLLVHLGLLLLWQPFLRAEQRISPMQGFILSLVAFGVMLALDWWLLAFWVVVLAGLVGGKVFQHHARWQRLSYLVVLAYLLALLAVVILPEIAPSPEISPEIRSAAEYLLPLAFVLILALPAEPEPADTAQVIDFFYSMFLMLLLVVVILGSFTFMTLRRTGYLEALTYTVFVTAGAVLLVGLAWNPRSGFAGLNVFFVRYLFSIGLPVEQWLHFLAELLQREP